MPDEKDKKENGENDEGNGKKTKPIIINETPEEKKARVYENRKAQYIVFRLAEILKVEPLEKIPKSIFMIFETDEIKFDLVEILEKALLVIEGKNKI